METRLPIPKNWQDFELLCHKLWREMWGDPNAQRNGRQGQAQQGVDIWGEAARFTRLAGVQCKDKDGRLGSYLTVEELNAECKKATTFRPRLDDFTMATTAPRDAKLQKSARLMTENRTYPFAVHVWSWDEIEEEIRYRPSILSAFYGKAGTPSANEARKLTLSLLSPRDQISSFFTRPEIQIGVAQSLREHLLPVAFELAENSFIHGKATRFSIQCEKHLVVFEDDGAAFNPATSLNCNETSIRSHIGSYVFYMLRRRFASDLTISHERSNNTNRLILRFTDALSAFGAPLRMDIPVDLTNVYSRDTARKLAASLAIPTGTKEIALIVTGVVVHSGVCEFFWSLVARLAPDMRLTISVPDKETVDFLEAFSEPDPRVSFVSRQTEG